jgi:hypothetical protein
VIVHARITEGERVVKHVRYTGDLTPDWSRAIWYDGVEPLETIKSKAAGSTSLEGGTSIKIEKSAFEFEGKIALKGTLDYDIDLPKLSEIKVNQLKTTVGLSLTGTGRAKTNCTTKISLGRVPLTDPLLPSYVYVDLALELTAEVSGEITVTLGGECGGEWSNTYQKFLPIHEESDPLITLGIKGSVSLKLLGEIGTHIWLVGDVVKFSASVGFKLTATRSWKRPYCMDADVKLVGAISVKSEMKIFKFGTDVTKNLWQAELELWKWHYEWNKDGGGIHRVPKCTYGGDHTVSFVTLTNRQIPDLSYK